MNRLLLILFVPAALLLTSCNDNDGYSLDRFWVGMATVENPDNRSNFYLNLDNNDKLWIAANAYSNYRPATGQRIIADYTILNDKPGGSGYQHDVKLNGAYNVLTKNVFNITAATQDSIGNDPIGVRDIWVGGGFLNIRFFFDANNKQHFLNLVRDTAKVYDDNLIHLEFRHNAYNDAARYRVGGWVSFNLNSLFIQPFSEKANIVVHVKELDGNNKEYKFYFDPTDNSVTPREYSRSDYEEGANIPVE